MEVRKSIRLAFLLRHDSQAFNDGRIDERGWRKVEDLHDFTKEELEEIVRKDDKGRYEFNEDLTLIRACQGHSIPVDVEFESLEPPEILYHGTSDKFIESIREQGIKKMSRLYVHLSQDKETALKVGKRHGGQPVIIQVDSGAMFKDGLEFFHSKNGYWLTDYVDFRKYGTII